MDDLLVAADWKGATIFDVLRAQIKAFGDEDRVSMSGPSVLLSPNPLQHLGMAFHELGTNSAKYGVLSGAQGTIAVSWNVAESEGRKFLKLTWDEQDGSAVQNVATEGGFGTVVLNRVAPQAAGGRGKLLFGPHGVTWTLEAPMDCVEHSKSEYMPCARSAFAGVEPVNPARSDRK